MGEVRAAGADFPFVKRISPLATLLEPPRTTRARSSCAARRARVRNRARATAPTKDAGFEYTSPIVVRSLTHMKVRAFDEADNASSPLSLTIRSLAERLAFGAPTRLCVRPEDRYPGPRHLDGGRTSLR